MKTLLVTLLVVVFLTVLDEFESRISDLESARTEALFLPIIVTVTAYSPEVNQTDDSPYLTAFLTPVDTATIAVSRDLFENGWVAGKKVYIKGLGTYTINDLMHARKQKQLDVFHWSLTKAKEFGRRKYKAVLLNI